jgi:hypothetical protein
MNQVKYPQGCKDIQVELANDELIRRLKVILLNSSFTDFEF